MDKIAKFEKVSYEQFYKDFKEVFFSLSDSEIQAIYDDIKLPTRATTGSAGYDFFIPTNLELKPNNSLKIPTGIKCHINEGWVLAIFPRSGLGFKYRFGLDNTVGIIDSDYINAKNEGHIIIKVCNDSYENKSVLLNKSEGFAQGIFLHFGITEDDFASASRVGGFGSTTNNGK